MSQNNSAFQSRKEDLETFNQFREIQEQLRLIFSERLSGQELESEVAKRLLDIQKHPYEMMVSFQRQADKTADKNLGEKLQTLIELMSPYANKPEQTKERHPETAKAKVITGKKVETILNTEEASHIEILVSIYQMPESDIRLIDTAQAKDIARSLYDLSKIMKKPATYQNVLYAYGQMIGINGPNNNIVIYKAIEQSQAKLEKICQRIQTLLPNDPIYPPALRDLMEELTTIAKKRKEQSSQ